MYKFHKTIEKAKQTTLQIEKLISDDNLVCEYLNRVDREYLKSYLDKDSSGPVVSLRKEIARCILDDCVTPDVVLSVINKHKNEKKTQLKSWVNTYKILHPFVNESFKEISKEIEELTEFIKKEFGSVKKANSNGFYGAQQQGSSVYSTKFFNNSRKNQSESNQFFFDFIDGRLKYGFHNFKQNKDLVERFDSSIHDFDFDVLFKYIEDNKSLILNDINKDTKRRIWLYSPGRNAKYWNECIDRKIFALGWNELGDLSHYNSKEEIKEKLKVYGEDSSNTNSSLANWNFANLVNIGDIVVAKSGRTEYIGYGIVTSDYIYDEEFVGYKSIRKIDWKKTGTWSVDKNLPLKTLTEIKSVDQINKLIYLLGINELDEIDREEQILQFHSLFEEILESNGNPDESFSEFLKIANKNRNFNIDLIKEYFYGNKEDVINICLGIL